MTLLPSHALAGLLVAATLALPRLATAEVEVVHQSSYDVRPGGTLVVKVEDIDLELVTGDSKRVEVEVTVDARDMEWALERFERMRLHVDGDRDRVMIRARHAHSRDHGWRDHGWRRGGMSVVAKVTLPEKFNLDIDTDDGNVTVDRLRGSVEIQTSDGDIELRDVQGPRVLIDTSDGDVRIGAMKSPDIQIETSDGSIRADGLDGEEIDLRTSDGDIDVDALSGALNASTSDGDIRVDIERFAATTLRTSDGNVSIYAKDDMKADVDLTGGDLVLRRRSLNFDGEVSDHYAHGQLNGGGPRLRVTSRDGKILLATRR